MQRLFRLTNISRALNVFVAFACIALALTPPLPQARGEGAVSLAVIAPENSAHAAASVLDQIARAIYDGAVSSGHYDVKGGGPIKVEASITGDVLTAALTAASRANADQVLVSDVVKVGEGKVVYRMTIYKVNPMTFGRSQVFTQQFPPSDPRVMASQFASNLATLEAPRTYTGVIYALTPALTSDTGSEEGFRLGQRFNVVRSGKKVAEAQIVGIDSISATVNILNPSAGYQAQIGDRLISQEQGPAIPVSTTSSNNGVLSVIAALVGIGAGLIAIGTNHAAPSANCVGPTPSGPGCGSIPPSGGGTFTVSLTTQSGPPNQPVLTFTFSKPVVNHATFPFGATTHLYVTSQVGISGMPTPPQPIAAFGGASGTFDGTGQVLTITTTGTLTPGFVYFIFFTHLITATDGSVLVDTPFRFPTSGTCCAAALRTTRPVNSVAPVKPVKPHAGNNGNHNDSGSNGGKQGH